MAVSMRCYETGDIWFDCDKDEKVQFHKRGHHLVSNDWKLKVNKDNTAVLFLEDQKWAELMCR